MWTARTRTTTFACVLLWRSSVRATCFAEISAESPLNIAANRSAETSGLQAPFAQGSYDASMSKNSEYTAGINIFWHDWHYTATPGIPLRNNAIDTLMDRMEHYFRTPARFPGMLYISAPSPTYAP
jgi:hypothetical protein